MQSDFMERVKPPEDKQPSVTPNNQPQDRDEAKHVETMMKRSQQRERADSKLRNGINVFVRLLPLITINVLGLFIIGLDNFVEGKWDWSIFSEASFWYSYASFQTANWLIAITFLTNSIKKLKSGHAKYLENLDVVQLMVDKDHDHAFITRQAEIETLRRKRETIELNAGEKLYRLRNKHNIKDVTTYLNDYEKREDTPKWRERRVYGRVRHFYDMLTYKWQVEYLRSYKGSIMFKLRFPAVTRSILVSGFQARRSNGNYHDYKSRVFGTSAKLIAPNIATASLVSFILLSFQFVLKEPNATTWLKFLIQVMMIVWNTIMTTTFAGTIFILTHMRVSEERRSDLELFKKRDENGNADTQDILDLIYKSENLNRDGLHENIQKGE